MLLRCIIPARLQRWPLCGLTCLNGHACYLEELKAFKVAMTESVEFQVKAIQTLDSSWENEMVSASISG